jgi:cation transport regulator ChaB
MPKTTRSGKPKQDELPSTLQRSPKKAQRTFAKTYDSAAEQYDDDSRAARTAYSSLKHSYEKVGDHWEAKGEKGPSDRGGRGRRNDTHGGVDANASKKHLYEIAQRLDVSGRSKMDKAQLVEAIDQANQRRTAQSRSS